ncbi:MAG: Protein of unknown function (DUF2905) [Roseibaca calidilacus]|uniref:Uncharacterized protein n=1 Tax=Roseibaca calidilacus TaxID=1666912 RepID=A0A0P7W4Z8_9RHOB|nr:hypothetical protein [Roseibaca calidilacus]KPP91749.1 MAG: Protein of unknown function (DUF2905) [Roseibaca calidilacus]CUX82580.1 hypothetical protein Ga0058931_2462 [Roseibaca calidilacus]
MFLEFFAVIVAGVAGFGTALIAHRLTLRRLPDWTAPFGAAIAMVLMVIYLEYSWAGRFEAGLPEDVTVVSRNEHRVWYRPWTFVVPLTTRIIAVDNRIRQPHSVNPDMVLTGVILKERWALTFGFKSIFDCAAGRRADLSEGTVLDEEGIPQNVDWFTMDPDDPFLTTACGGEMHNGGSSAQG